MLTSQAAICIWLREIWHVNVLEVNGVLKHPFRSTSALALVNSNAHVYETSVGVFLGWSRKGLSIFVGASNAAAVGHTYVQRFSCNEFHIYVIFLKTRKHLSSKLTSNFNHGFIVFASHLPLAPIIVSLFVFTPGHFAVPEANRAVRTSRNHGVWCKAGRIN